MPSTDFVTLKAAVKAKLETVSILQHVTDYHTADITGWPAATFEPSGNSAELFTNDDNFRGYGFSIVLLQEMSEAGREKAIDILCETVDAVISAFDEDFNLGGACHFMQAAPSDWSEVTMGNGAVKVALINLTCMKEVTVI
jgi:hypothetical protein